MPETTLDDLQYDNLKLRQNKRGYRSTEDSLILLYSIIKKLGFDYKGNAFEFGTGSGIISLLLAAKLKNIIVTAIEIQESLFGLAKENIVQAGLEGRVILVKADGRKIKEYFHPQKYDIAFSNPPFFPKGAGRSSPFEERQKAKHELLCTMEDVLVSFDYLLKKSGRGFIIYPVERLEEFVKRIKSFDRMKLVNIEFYKDIKHRVGTWKASQNENDFF